MYNDTFNLFLSVLCLSLIKEWWWALLVAANCYFQNHAVGPIILFVVLLYARVALPCTGWRRIYFLVLGAAVGVSFAYWISGGAGAFFLGDRFEIYRASVSYWLKDGFMPTWGFGQFAGYSNEIQRAFQIGGTQRWLSLHSDHLQMLLELGPILFLTWCYLWIDLLTEAWQGNHKREYLALWLLWVFAVYNFPFRMPLFNFLFGHICWRVFHGARLSVGTARGCTVADEDESGAVPWDYGLGTAFKEDDDRSGSSPVYH